jgi:hypothetical protein
MKLKKKDILKAWRAMEILSNRDDISRKFAYCIVRNKKLLNDEREALLAATEPSGKYKEFEKKRIETCMKHCDKNEKGEPVINEKNQFVATGENNEQMHTALDVLTTEYKEAIDGFNTQNDEINKLLEEEIEFTPYQVDLESFPDTLSPVILEAIDFIIKEEPTR